MIIIQSWSSLSLSRPDLTLTPDPLVHRLESVKTMYSDVFSVLVLVSENFIFLNPSLQPSHPLFGTVIQSINWGHPESLG